MKKLSFLVVSIVVLVLAAGGFFYWWQSQADVRALNKTLPEGVRVVKSLIGDKYRVVNKIDGYEFKIPPEWKGVEEIEYIPERGAEGYIASSISLGGKENIGGGIGIDYYKSGGDKNASLESWAISNFNTFNLVGDFKQDKVGEINVVKTIENIHFGGEFVYFFKKNSIFLGITCPSEEFIRYIISNGKW